MLAEAGTFRGGELRVRQVGERVAAPEGQRGLVLAGSGQPFETHNIDRIAWDVGEVAPPGGHQHRRRNDLAQLRHVLLQGLRGGLRRMVRPHVVDEGIDGYHSARLDQQPRQDGALARPPQVQRRAVPQHLQWPEKPELKRHAALPLRLPGRVTGFPPDRNRPMPPST